MAIQAQFPSFGSQQDHSWMDNGCGGFNQNFYVNNSHQQQQQKQQQLQQQCNLENQQQQFQNLQQRNRNFCLDNNVISPLDSSPSTSFGTCNNFSVSYLQHQNMAAHEEKQRQEIDHFLRLQNERLRLVLQEQRRQQLAVLMKRVETKVVPLLRQKDEEIAQAAKRALDLDDYLKRLEMENQAWQRLAQENEAMVVSLNNTIEQLRDKASICSLDNNGGSIAEDAESCCDGEEEDNNKGLDKEKINVVVARNEEEMVGGRMMCKVCNSRNSCVLYLPCRHLCSCKACETFLDSCPVCQTPKKASIEVLMV